jgi:hypothetical protein
MLLLNRSLLNREYILINVLKALASIIFICNIHVTFFFQTLHRDILRYLQMEYFVHLMRGETRAVDNYESSTSPESYHH